MLQQQKLKPSHLLKSVPPFSHHHFKFVYLACAGFKLRSTWNFNLWTRILFDRLHYVCFLRLLFSIPQVLFQAFWSCFSTNSTTFCSSCFHILFVQGNAFNALMDTLSRFVSKTIPYAFPGQTARTKVTAFQFFSYEMVTKQFGLG